MMDPLNFLPRVAAEYGDVARFRVGYFDAFLISGPAEIEQVLVKQKGLLKDRVTASLEMLIGQGLVTSEGELWKKQRKLAAPLLQRRHINSYAAAMVARTARRMDGWTDGQAIDVNNTLFSAEGLSKVDIDISEPMDEVMDAFRELLDTWKRFLPSWWPTKERAKLKRNAARMDGLVMRLIELAKEQDGGDDLVSLLLAARYDDGSGIPDQLLRDEVMTMVAAGHETTAQALTWAFVLLSEHDEARQRLEAEVDSVLDGRAATADDVARLPWTNAVVKEAMRLYPPAWIVGREPVEDFRLGEWHVPKGAQLLLSQWVVHRDERWFEAPLEFRPERWLGEGPKDLPRFAYFPFGGGPRVCIGNHFATMEAALVLATIAQRFRVELTAKVEPIQSVTLRVNGAAPARLHTR